MWEGCGQRINGLHFRKDSEHLHDAKKSHFIGILWWRSAKYECFSICSSEKSLFCGKIVTGGKHYVLTNNIVNQVDRGCSLSIFLEFPF